MNKFTTLSNRDNSIIFKWDDEQQEISVHAKFNILNKEEPLEYVIGNENGMFEMYNDCKLLKQFLYRTLTDVDIIFENKIRGIEELRILIYFIDNGYIELYQLAREKWINFII